MSEELLIRFLTMTYTKEELLEVEKWISAGNANADWLFEMERVWSLKDELRNSDHKKIEAAYRRFVRTVSPTKQKPAVIRHLHSGWMKYAAAIVIVFLLAANIYQAFKNKPSDDVAANIIEVPIGQRAAITLADGTKVWLNSGSVMSYPATFGNENRTVRLDGEGYFDVATDRERPFMVHTAMLEVKVTGTKFNVQAYPDEGISVSLLEGQLHVEAGNQSALMAVGELVTWSGESGLVHHKDREVRHAVQWTSGEFMFVDTPLVSIVKALERHFGTTIIIDTPELYDERFTCRTQSGATLEQVLSLLKNTKKLTYSVREQTIHIK